MPKHTPEWGDYPEGPNDGTECHGLMCTKKVTKGSRTKEKSCRLAKWVYREYKDHVFWFCSKQCRQGTFLIVAAINAAHDQLSESGKKTDCVCNICEKETFKEIAYVFKDQYYCDPVCMFLSIVRGNKEMLGSAMEDVQRAKDEGLPEKMTSLLSEALSRTEKH